MKKFRYIIMLLAVIGFTACDNKSIEDLQGTFSNITYCTFNSGSVQETTKLGKGIKALNTQFTDASGNTLTLSFGSKEWILGEGTFTPVATVSTAGTYAGSVNGSAISTGNMDVSKVNDTYCFIYSSFNNHELCYATSKYPDRDFTYGGTIVSNGDIGYEGREAKDRLNHTGTNHGSIECIDGEWYVFYHRLTHNSDYSRQACAEKIEILPDGRIPQVQITSCGLNDGPLLPGRYPAVICCNLTNGKMKHGSNKKAATTEPCVSSGNGERYLTGITNGTLITYKSFELSGKNRLSIQARSGKGIFHVLLDQKEVGEIRLEGSGQWQTVSTIFHTDKKVCSLSLRYEGTDKAELKMFQIEKE